MKIYFVGSISGKEKFQNNYSRIIKTAKSMGSEVFEITMNPTKDFVYGMSDDEKIDQYKRVLGWINATDFMIAEVSYPSIGVGYEVSLALEKGKPVIAMHEKSDNSHFLEGIKSDKLSVVDYTLPTLEKDLKKAIDKAMENIDTRFNFFISPQISNYLDFVAKRKRIPRAVYIRRLLEEEMEKVGFEK